jgi:hypothetical protein
VSQIRSDERQGGPESVISIVIFNARAARRSASPRHHFLDAGGSSPGFGRQQIHPRYAINGHANKRLGICLKPAARNSNLRYKIRGSPSTERCSCLLSVPVGVALAAFWSITNDDE